MIRKWILPVDYNALNQTERREVRLQYIELQKNRCAHCWASLDGPATPQVREKWIDVRLFPSGFFQHPIHLHHDHQSGRTIGAVHARCNAVLWQYHNE